jgi:hypothetical protein
VKVAEVVEALFGAPDAIPYHAVRAEMGLRDGDLLVGPLDTARLRTLRPPLLRAASLPTALPVA